MLCPICDVECASLAEHAKTKAHKDAAFIERGAGMRNASTFSREFEPRTNTVRHTAKALSLEDHDRLDR